LFTHKHTDGQHKDIIKINKVSEFEKFRQMAWKDKINISEQTQQTANQLTN
jgi:hypothetical protein